MDVTASINKSSDICHDSRSRFLIRQEHEVGDTFPAATDAEAEAELL